MLLKERMRSAMPASAKGNETQAGVSEPIGQSSDAPYKQTPIRKRR